MLNCMVTYRNTDKKPYDNTMKITANKKLINNVFGHGLGGDSINEALHEATRITDTLAESFGHVSGISKLSNPACNTATITASAADSLAGLGEALCPSVR